MAKLELPGALLLVGCGKMGGALLRGWLKQGVAAKSVYVVDLAPKDLDDVKAAGVHILTSPDQLPADLKPAIILLAVKPQFMDEALGHYKKYAGADTTYLSIAAGKTVAYFKRALGENALIVRSMPNTPAAVSRGMTVICRDKQVPASILDLCGQLLTAVGEVAWIDDEQLLNQVTAVSGGGPAYVFLLIEALAEAGRVNGLPADLAMQLARSTVCGSGELAYQSSESATALRQAVMSPKGTTLEAINVLMADDGIQPLMNRAIAAATRRSRELAG
ncbi:pyrroline-5-carboxylate reductase [Dongia rigui]|uniref:Pyrroline-5-carboxylate reductase n=1 Tax=Dongia rigui TaxID=940149 RepID=A0ABU5DWJ6_9PROT|nr:pyrroline-5-carboxylate reductase [Dongia rigui]MDY0871357.1 pyrroline-5-carboxylate reductase [Dongia rigui]